MFASLAALLAIPVAYAQVTATAPNGVTNPAAPSMAAVGSTVNQTSDSRLLTLNSVDDFCLFGPPENTAESLIGNVEPIVVAYCTKPRNGARIIPDGAIKSAHFVRTPAYVQIYGLFDGTKINIQANDYGGELDPHGAENLGNPIGGNVTSNVSGQDVFYQEWMSFISFDQFCLRICTAEVDGVTVDIMCEHELDVMGCQFVMPGNYYNGDAFTSCDADAGVAPGLYPQANGSTSTFRQRYTGSYTNEGTVAYWTVGQTVTPTGAYTTPASSNCVAYPTISNGIDTANFNVVAQTLLSGGSAAATTGMASTTSSASSSQATTTSRASTGAGASTSTAASTTGASTRASSAASAAASGASSAAAAVTSAAASSTNRIMVNAGLIGYLVAGMGVVVGGFAVLL